jgi:spore coat polysaccharide biosynthesis protein SpsF (cytidylyltransferase family)
VSVVGTILAARMNSTRLPGKALRDLGGVPMIRCLIERLRGTRLSGSLYFATTERADDDALADCVASLGVPVFRGSVDDVAQRYFAAAQEYGLDWIIRVTGDCPFVDAESLDHCMAQWRPDDACALFSTKGAFPIGIDYEVFASASLAAELPRMSAQEREHVTPRFYQPNHGYTVRRFSPPPSWPAVSESFVIDTPADYEKAKRWLARLGTRQFRVQQLLELQAT